MEKTSANGQAQSETPAATAQRPNRPKGRKGRSRFAAPLAPVAALGQQAIQATGHSKLIGLDQVKDASISWLFRNQIPLGCITMLDGSKAEGKSTLMYEIAARLTSGKPMPFCDGPAVTGGAILLQAEDDLGATVKKNFLAAGGIAEKVRVFNKADTLHLDDPADLKLIQGAAEEIGAKLMVVDPMTEFFGRNLRDEKTTRTAFHLLRALAASMGMAVVLVRHFTKSGTVALYRGLGGVAVINAARATLVVGHDPSSDDPHQHVLAFNAGNLPRDREVSLVYRTVKRGEAIVIEWLGDSKHTADDLIVATHSADEHSQLEEAAYVLYTILATAPAPLPATAVYEVAKDALVSVGTLKRAKKLLKVRSRRGSFDIEVQGEDGNKELQTKTSWTWELPKDKELLAPYKERLDREASEDKGGRS